MGGWNPLMETGSFSDMFSKDECQVFLFLVRPCCPSTHLQSRLEPASLGDPVALPGVGCTINPRASVGMYSRWPSI